MLEDNENDLVDELIEDASTDDASQSQEDQSDEVTPDGEQEPEEATETPEAAEESEPQQKKLGSKAPPLSAVIKLERENRRMRRVIAEHEAQKQLALDAQNVQTPPEPVVGPLDKWLADHEEELNIDPDLATPAAVLVADRKWQAEHQQKARQMQQAAQEQQTIMASLARARVDFSPDKMGDGLDFESVTADGSPLLTERDITIIRTSGEDAGEEMYRLCLKRILKSDTEAADRVREAVQARRLSKIKSSGESVQVARKTTNPPTRQQVLQAASRNIGMYGLEYPDAGPGG